MSPRRWLPIAALLVVLPALAKAPALDEESYLWLGAHLDPLRPYDWRRAWPPYDADGFVFAHPPLHLWWMWALHTLPVFAQRLVSGLTFAPLLGWSVARLAERGAHHPNLAAGLWITSATVVLGLQDSLMVDLPAAALLTFGLAAYREAVETEDRRWEVAAGLGLGLAVLAKYPMALAWPVVALHTLRRRGRWLPLALAVALPAAGEAFLFAVYGREHLFEVWSRRGEIARGPLVDRLLGTLTRGALLPAPFLLLRTDPRTALVAVALAAVALAAARPDGLSPAEVTLLLLFAFGGALAFARGARTLRPALPRRRKGDRDDALLLGGVVAVWFLGVALVHNYASARYLLPAAGPLAVLLARSAEEVRGGKLLARGSIVAWGALAVVVALADYRYARAGWEVGTKVAAAGTGTFAGEWSFRAAMEAGGWTRLRPDRAPPAGSWVAVVDNASAGTVDTTGWEPMRRVESDDRFPLRVNDLGRDVSLYAETLGTLPLGWSQGHLEGATLFRVSTAAGSGVGPRDGSEAVVPTEETP